MFNEVWVICDEDAKPEPALQVAAEMARRSGADLRLLHVVAAAGEEELAAELLSAAPAPAGIPTRVSVLSGRRDEVAVEAIREGKPDAVVVASSGGEGRLSGILQGTSGSTLLREAGCPVVFVPPEAAAPSAEGPS